MYTQNPATAMLGGHDIYSRTRCDRADLGYGSGNPGQSTNDPAHLRTSPKAKTYIQDSTKRTSMAMDSSPDSDRGVGWAIIIVGVAAGAAFLVYKNYITIPF